MHRDRLRDRLCLVRDTSWQARRDISKGSTKTRRKEVNVGTWVNFHLDKKRSRIDREEEMGRRQINKEREKRKWNRLSEAECFEALLALLRAGVKWTSDNSSESNVYTSVKGGRGEKRQRRRRRRRRRQPRQRTNPLRAKKSEQRRGRIFSIWADGNLRLLHIGLCATEVLCNSRARLLPSLSRPSVSLFFFRPFFYYHYYFFFFFFFLFRISLPFSL